MQVSYEKSQCLISKLHMVLALLQCMHYYYTLYALLLS